MKRSRLLRFAAVLALLPVTAAAQTIAPPAPVATGDAIARIKAAGVLRVGLTGDYRPFSWRDPSTQQLSGIDVDVANGLASALGVKAQIVQTTWPTMTADLTAGKFDVAMGGVSRSAQRAAAGLLSTTYFVDGKTPLVRKDDAAKYQTIADIDKPTVTIDVNPGGTNESFVNSTFKNAKVEKFTDNVSIFPALASGKGDVMITDGVEAILAAKADPRLVAVHPDKPFNSVEKVYYVRKDEPDLLAFIDTWVTKAKADGTYAKLRTTYLGS